MARVPATPSWRTTSSAPRSAAPTASMTASRRSRTSVEQVEHGLGVGRDDLAVEHRVSRRHPRHVADALAGQGQVVGRVRRPADRRPAPPAGAGCARSGPRRGRAPPGSAAPVRRRTARTSASTSSTASGREPSCGVTAHGRPSKSAALAASGPERSLPAIGWPPTYRSTPATSSTAASGPDLTLPTSVTTAPYASVSSRACRITGAEVVRRHRDHDELRPVLGGRGPAGAQPGGGAHVVGRLVGSGAPRGRPAAARGRWRFRGDRCRRSRPDPPAHHEAHSSGVARTRVRSRRSAAAPWR